MNTIATQIADFLKEFTPFDHLTFQELAEIAGNIRVINLEKNKTLFQINDILHDSFYVVASGVIHLSVIADAEETILNKCHEGSIFGLRAFFAKNNYQMTAKAREESVVYAIPITVFKPFVTNNSAVMNYLLESFATNSPNSSSTDAKGNLNSDSFRYTDQQSEIQFFQTLSYNTAPLKIVTDITVREVAQLMSETRITSALICEQNLPIGIVTDTDMRSKIATGRFLITDAISKIMSKPVVCVLENVSLAEAQLTMLKNNVSHLCVTTDGTNKTVVKGIISQQDLIAAQASNPAF
jgi:CBS domain-containing protein